jgi:ATP-binding cassette subfamily C protein
MYSPVSALFGTASGAVYELAAFKRIGALFAGGINRDSESMRGNDLVGPASLCLRDVAFAYDKQPIFSKLSATIAAGRCTALAGENGAGKSTLALMMLGLEQPGSGTVHLNDQHMSLAAIQGSLAYVPQEVFIFVDTLRANITMGRDISDHQIEQLLHDLGWIDTLFAAPFGLDWMIAEGGMRCTVNNGHSCFMRSAVFC